MRCFKKEKALKKINNRNNEKVKIISIVVSLCLLVGAIIYFSFARFEKVQSFSLIDGNVNISRNAILIPGSFFNVALKTVAGDSDPDVSTSNLSITSIQKSLVAPSESDNALDVSDGSVTEAPIYMWFDNGTIYLYSIADKIYMSGDASDMFGSLSNVESLDLSFFDTSRVVNMNSMFAWSNINSFNFSNFDTSNVTDMSYMFQGNHSITNLDLSGFNTSNVTSLKAMFSYLSSIENLNISSFDTLKVTDMSGMFLNNNLEIVDLSSFDTSSLINTSNMFAASKVKTIYVSNKWSSDGITNHSGMFVNSSALVGGSGTTYSSSHTDKSYAHIDGGTSNPGYFTLNTN